MFTCHRLKAFTFLALALPSSFAGASNTCDPAMVVRDPVRIAKCYQLLNGNVRGLARFTWASFPVDYYRLSSPCPGKPFNEPHFHVELRGLSPGDWQGPSEGPPERALQIRSAGKTKETEKEITTVVKTTTKKKVTTTKAIYSKKAKTLELSTTERTGLIPLLIGHVLLQCD